MKKSKRLFGIKYSDIIAIFICIILAFVIKFTLYLLS